MFLSIFQIGNQKNKRSHSTRSTNRPSSVPTKRLRFENLEQRALLTILTWDPDGLNNGQFGGSGNWAAASAWVDTATNIRYTWNSGRTGDEAVFKGAAGTVTVNTPINARKLNFIETDGYTLANAGYQLTISGSGVTINAAQSSTINANITATAANQQWSTASGKTLAIGGSVNFAGRQLLIQDAGTATFSSAVSGADFRANGDGTATFTGSSSLTTTSFTLAGSGTSGTINWNSTGALNPGTLYVGFYGQGAFVQTAGVVNAAALRYEGSSSSTLYNLYGGSLNTPLILGNPGSGLINSGCSLNFGGGTLRATGNFTASYGLTCTVVAGTTSYINGNGYNVALNNPVLVNGNGILDLSSSNVTVRSVIFQNGDGGLIRTGSLNILGGGYSVVAYNSGAINANVTVNIADHQWLTAAGKTLSIGGSVNFAGHQLLIQGAGTATFNGAVSGADFRANGDGTATFTGSSSLTTTSFTLAGSGTSGTINWNSSGALNPGYFLYVGFGGFGTFTQTAGNVNASILRYEASSSGTAYNLNGGTLTTPSILGNPGDGNINAGCSLNFGGGTLTATAALNPDDGLSYSAAASTASTINIASYAVTLAGALSGSGNLTKTGSNTLTLSGNNSSYSGNICVSQADLKIGANNALGSSSGVQLNTNTTLNLDNHSIAIGRLYSTSGGTVQIGTAALTLGDSTNQTFAGVITGTGSLVKQGTGTQTFTNANTYTGGTTISSGTLQLGNGYSTNGSIVGDVTNNSNLIFAAAVDQIFSGDISSEYGGYVEVNNNIYATLTLSGTNTHTAGTKVVAGTLKLGSDSALCYYGGLGIYINGVVDLNAYDVTIEAIYGVGTITDNNTTPGTTTLTTTVYNGFVGTVLDGEYRMVIVQ
jgi:fibronectin-binding autotransporter adhesin